MNVTFSNGIWAFVSKGVGIEVTAVTVDALLAKVSPLYRWAPWHKQKMQDAFNKALEKHDIKD